MPSQAAEPEREPGGIVARLIHEFWREKRGAPEWCQALDLTVRNPPGGWRGRDPLGWEEPIGLVEFYHRMCRSVLGGTSRCSGWIALMDLANALEDEAQDALDENLAASLLTGEPVNDRPLPVQIALPAGEREAGFFLTVPCVPAVEDDFQLAYHGPDGIETRSYRVGSVTWFVNRGAADGAECGRVRVNLARPRHLSARSPR